MQPTSWAPVCELAGANARHCLHGSGALQIGRESGEDELGIAAKYGKLMVMRW